MKNKYRRMIFLMCQIPKKMNASLSLHPKSKHTFSIRQHIILLVLRQYESKSYESFVEWLEAATGIVLQLHLKTIPHFTILQKAAARISQAMLHLQLADSSKSYHLEKYLQVQTQQDLRQDMPAPYYSHRCNLRNAFTKMLARSDMKSQLVCAVVIQRHPTSHDIKHFPKLFSQMLDVIPMSIMVLDKGYDAESVHKMIQDESMISMIPTRNMTDLMSRTHGRYRRQMKREFDESLYHQRNKTETISSVIKRRFGSEIKSYNDTMREKELLYRVLAYNCHRMCLISLVWI